MFDYDDDLDTFDDDGPEWADEGRHEELLEAMDDQEDFDVHDNLLEDAEDAGGLPVYIMGARGLGGIDDDDDGDDGDFDPPDDHDGPDGDGMDWDERKQEMLNTSAFSWNGHPEESYGDLADEEFDVSSDLDDHPLTAPGADLHSEDDELADAQLEAAESTIDKHDSDEHQSEGQTTDDPFGLGSI